MFTNTSEPEISPPPWKANGKLCVLLTRKLSKDEEADLEKFQTRSSQRWQVDRTNLGRPQGTGIERTFVPPPPHQGVLFFPIDPPNDGTAEAMNKALRNLDEKILPAIHKATLDRTRSAVQADMDAAKARKEDAQRDAQIDAMLGSWSSSRRNGSQ